MQRPALLLSHKLSAISVRAVLAESIRVRVVVHDGLPGDAVTHPALAEIAARVRLLERGLHGAHGAWAGL